MNIVVINSKPKTKKDGDLFFFDLRTGIFIDELSSLSDVLLFHFQMN